MLFIYNPTSTFQALQRFVFYFTLKRSVFQVKSTNSWKSNGCFSSFPTKSSLRRATDNEEKRVHLMSRRSERGATTRRNGTRRSSPRAGIHSPHRPGQRAKTAFRSGTILTFASHAIAKILHRGAKPTWYLLESSGDADARHQPRYAASSNVQRFVLPSRFIRSHVEC